MNINLIKNYLHQQDEMWQLIFTIFFIKDFKQTHLDPSEVEIDECINFCRNDEDIIKLGKIVQYVDINYISLMEKIDNIITSKSYVWLLDFIKCAEIELDQKFLRDFIPLAFTEAYCWLFSTKPEKIDLFYESVDKNFVGTIKALNQREAYIKRNFLLILEGCYGTRTLRSIKELTFREIIDLYINNVPLPEIRKAYQKAQTAADNIEGNTEEARNALKSSKEYYDYAYYYPFLSERENIQRCVTPKGSITTIAQDFLRHCYDNLWQKTDDSYFYFEEEENDDEDDEDDDDDEDIQKRLTRLTVFVDFQELCVIDVLMENEFCAHIYIKKRPNSYTDNYISEFLVCDKNFIYTVEFIDYSEDSAPIKEFTKSVIKKREEFENFCNQIGASKNKEDYSQLSSQGFKYLTDFENNYIFPPISII